MIKACGLSLAMVFFTTTVVAVTPMSRQNAMKRVATLEPQLKFAEIVETLQPFAASDDPQIALSLANAYMNLAVIGRAAQATSDPGDGRPPTEVITRKQIQPAIDFAQHAARHGNAGGYNLLYMIYGNGFGVKVDDAKAIGYLRQAAAGGDKGARYNYAVMLYEGRPFLKQDLAQACVLFGKLGRDDTTMTVAAYDLGQIIYRGQCGYKANKVEGMQLVSLAAKAGVRQAERDMGKSAEFGWLGEADNKKALSWYQVAADHGDPYSQWRIGMAYINGELGPKDSIKGVDYLRGAAASDFPQAMTDLGVMYVTGDGVSKDFNKARALYENAARLGEPHAFSELAVIYAHGEGAPIDKVHARTLHLQAGAMGESKSAALDQAFEQGLTVDQLNQSDIEFNEWQKERSENPIRSQ